MYKQWKWILGSLMGFFGLSGLMLLLSQPPLIQQTLRAANLIEKAQASPAATASAPSLETAIALAETKTDAINSWPGEILSKGDVNVYPSREGHIVDWYVHIGEHVQKGQALGRLSPQPATLELAGLLAERTMAVTRARTRLTASEQYVQQAKQRIETIKSALLASRDATIQLAERDAERDQQTSVGAAKELSAERVSREAAIRAAQIDLEQTRALIPHKRQVVRVAIERLVQRTGGKFSFNGTAPRTSTEALTMEFRRTIGILSSTSRETYRNALSHLLNALHDPNALPETEASMYAQAALEILSRSFQGSDLSLTELNDMRTDLTDDQKDFFDLLQAYKEIQRSAAVKDVNVLKLIADRDRDLTVSETQALVSRLTAQGAETSTRKLIAEAQVEFKQEQANLDATVADVERELALTRGEVKAAEAGYAVIAEGVTGQNILAPIAGTVSAIYKRNGDHVMADNAVASVSQHGSQTTFVRFRIPGNMPKPDVDETVTIERSGYSLEKIQGAITGVGAALDSAGAYMAEAKLTKETDWPVHVSVRVSLMRERPTIYLPLSAIWWNEEGIPHIWTSASSSTSTAQVISVGRVFGDHVEILAGVVSGAKYLVKANDARNGGEMGSDAHTTEPSPKKKIGTDMHGGDHSD